MPTEFKVLNNEVYVLVQCEIIGKMVYVKAYIVPSTSQRGSR